MKFSTCFPIAMAQYGRALLKTILVMKLIVFFIVVASLKVSATVYGQNIIVAAKQEPIEKVFSQIEKQTNYQFFYKNDVLRDVPAVTVSIESPDLQKVLKAVFSNQHLSYEIVGKTIVVKKKTNEATKNSSDNFQSMTIKGKVLDENNQPLAGASVIIKGTSLSAITNNQGEFSIANAPENSVLIISYIGYQPKEVKAETTQTISLTRSTSKLDEVQVIAYGTSTQRLSTGNISSVKAETIAQQPVTNPLQALIGRVAGLQITQSTGLPGSSMSVQIRGRNSIAANNDPLYIIDGVPFPSADLAGITTAVGVNPMNAINPNDIESISVLKDADATAIYGSRAANGVILITTKKGVAGKSKLDVNLKNGYGSVTRTALPLNTEQYLQLRRDAFTNSNITPTTTNAPDLLSWDPNVDNNIQNSYLGNTAQFWDASASLSGGNEQTTFLISGTYHKETSVGSDKDMYKRGNLHLSLNHTSLNKKLKITFQNIYTSDNNFLQNSNSSTFTSAIHQVPNYPIKDNSGNYFWVTAQPNYFALSNAYWKSTTRNLNTNLNVIYEVVEGLQIKGSVGYNRVDNNSMRPVPAIAQNPNSTPLGNNVFSDRSNEVFVFEPQLNYDRTIGKGKLQILGGSTIQQGKTLGRNLTVNSYLNDLLIESQGAGTPGFAPSSNTDYKFVSVFARATYNWDNKYIVNGNFRRDGSSRFGPGRQFGNFYSLGTAWLFSNEEFIKSMSWLSYGKLRASYGSTGSDGIGDYGYLSLYSNVSNYGNTLAINPSQIANDDYQWEVNKKLEFAIDLGLFKDRILLNSTWYQNRSGNQLVTYPLPVTTGFAGYVANLPALVQNRGWEFELSTRNIVKSNLEWSTSFNLTIPRNKLLSFPDIERTAYANSLVVGQPLNSLLKFHLLGIDPATGLAQIEDVNNNGVITNRSSYNGQGGDWVLAGTTDPKWFAGLGNSFRYKNVEIDIFFQYTKQLGNNLYSSSNSTNAFGQLSNTWTSHLDYWKQPGDQSTLPKPLASTNTLLTMFALSNKTVSDASFLRLRNVSISYKLHDKLTGKWGLNNLRIYAQGQNLLTVTDYIGYDPEAAANQGIAVPPLKMLSIGLQANF